MELRLLDEVTALDGRGVILLSVDEACASHIKNGTLIKDVHGKEHAVRTIAEHEGLYSLYLPNGDAAYFERLFRDVRVDATCFIVGENV